LTAINGNVSPTPTNLACDSGATWTSTPTASSEQKPINCVNWYEAYAFCIWDGGFLPSEAEWAYAADGGSQLLEYPWGSADPGTTNQYAICGDGNGACYYPSALSCTGSANVAPVGTAALGAGRWLQVDLAGSVFEWSLDYFTGYKDPCVDCAATGHETSDHGLRGGGFKEPPSTTFTLRLEEPPSTRLGEAGFRCARVP
jgi:formylglycine-generating enzyme required for sulfatase activity